MRARPNAEIAGAGFIALMLETTNVRRPLSARTADCRWRKSRGMCGVLLRRDVRRKAAQKRVGVAI